MRGDSRFTLLEVILFVAASESEELIVNVVGRHCASDS